MVTFHVFFLPCVAEAKQSTTNINRLTIKFERKKQSETSINGKWKNSPAYYEYDFIPDLK